jgi:hypothetical protein
LVETFVTSPDAFFTGLSENLTIVLIRTDLLTSVLGGEKIAGNAGKAKFLVKTAQARRHTLNAT